MSDFIFKKKQKFEFNAPKQLNKKQMNEFRQLDNEFDVNAMAFAKMSDEDRLVARERLAKGYEDEMIQAKGGAEAVNEREHKNIRKKAASKSRDAVKRAEGFRTKLNGFISKNTAAGSATTPALIGLAGLKTDKNATKENKEKVAAVKKAAPALYTRMQGMEELLNNLKSAGNSSDAGMLAFMEKELAEARIQWEHMQGSIDAVMPVTLPDATVVQEKLEFHKSNKNVNQHKFTMIDAEKSKDRTKPMVLDSGFRTDDPLEDELEESLKPKKIDWNRDIKAEYIKMKDDYESTEEKRYNTSKAIMKLKEDKSSLEPSYRIKTKEDKIRYDEISSEIKKKNIELEKLRYDKLTKKRQMRDLGVQRHVKEQMQKIIDESTREPKPTFEEIERTVNEYLKKVADQAALRFRTNFRGAVGIMQGRSLCLESSDYNTLVGDMYSPHTELPVSGNLTFGYLAGNNAKEYIGNGNKGEDDKVGDYGMIALKLNKELMKDRTGFVVGNSMGNYDMERGRSLNNPDILSAGTYIANTYKRANEVINEGKKLKSSEQEAALIDPGGRYYFECHFMGRISAEEIDEVTWIMKKGTMDMDFKSLKKELKDEDFQMLYDQVNVINSHPEEYGRDKNNPVKLTVWDNSGHSLSFADIKAIMESQKG